MRIPLGEDKLDSWYHNFAPDNDLRIALVGKYAHADAYHSVLQQLRFLGVRNVTYLPEPAGLENYDGIIIPGGWGERGVEALIETARICREQSIPCLGICLGLQIMAIEWARNVLGFADANSTEFNRNTKHPVVLLQEQQGNIDNMGGTARLGNWTTRLNVGSIVARLFNAAEITQRHRHRYEINSSVDFGEFVVSGRDIKTNLVETMEFPSHPFYVGVQFHPEFTPSKNPLFLGLVNAAAHRRRESDHSSVRLVSYLQNGTPGTYLSSLNLSDESRPILERIACMSAPELAAEGITLEQQAVLLRILALLDERERTLQAVEHELQSAERQMWEINSCVIAASNGRNATTRDEELAELQNRIDDATARLREKRVTYDERLSRLDEELRRTFRAS
jgi:CTP synthase